MRVTSGIEGAAHLKENFRTWVTVKRGKLVITLRQIGQNIARDAKPECPVLTGRLRGSISVNWSGSGKDRGDVDSKALAEDGVGQPEGEPGMTVVVGTNVTYGPAIEFGHMTNATKQKPRLIEGRPFLTPAYFSHEGDVQAKLGQVLSEDEHLK